MGVLLFARYMMFTITVESKPIVIKRIVGTMKGVLKMAINRHGSGMRRQIDVKHHARRDADVPTRSLSSELYSLTT